MPENLKRAMPPRILFLESLAPISGGQRVLINLAPALVQHFDVMALLPGEGALANELRAVGVSVAFAPMASYTLVSKGWRDALNFIFETPYLALSLVRFIRQHDIQLVYANNSRAFVWGTLGAWLAGKPIVWHAHNILLDKKTRALVSLFARLPCVRKIICPSDSSLAQFSRKAMVVPSGIDVQKFAPSIEWRDQKRAEWRVTQDEFAVGIVGDLIPLKGQDVFVRAAACVAEKIPNAIFFIVGEARPTDESQYFKTELESQIRNLQFAIRTLGFQSDIAAVLNALDVLVIASTTETGPLVLLQALACGVPVVSTPVGLAPRILSDGRCGDLFPIDNHKMLAEKLVLYASDRELRNNLRSIARQRAVAEFDLGDFQSRITHLIQEICNS